MAKITIASLTSELKIARSELYVSRTQAQQWHDHLQKLLDEQDSAPVADVVSKLRAENAALTLKLQAQIAARNRAEKLRPAYEPTSSVRTPAMEAARAAAMASGKSTLVA